MQGKISKILEFLLNFAPENKCGEIWLLATTQKNAKKLFHKVRILMIAPHA